jgi:hypothetical protein
VGRLVRCAEDIGRYFFALIPGDLDSQSPENESGGWIKGWRMKKPLARMRARGFGGWDGLAGGGDAFGDVVTSLDACRLMFE